MSIISLAPASVALSRLAGSRLVLRISTAASGLEPCRSEIRSAPLPSGRPRSLMTRSKSDVAAAASAEARLSAVVTMWPLRPRSRARIRAVSSLSSTNSTRSDRRGAKIPGTADVDESMILVPLMYEDEVLGVVEGVRELAGV